MKKVLAVVVCVMALAALGVSGAQAAYAWTPFTNYNVGLVFGQYLFVDNVTQNYYIMDPANQSALLATALTAKSTGGTLSAFVDTTANGSICYGTQAQ